MDVRLPEEALHLPANPAHNRVLLFSSSCIIRIEASLLEVVSYKFLFGGCPITRLALTSKAKRKRKCGSGT